MGGFSLWVLSCGGGGFFCVSASFCVGVCFCALVDSSVGAASVKHLHFAALVFALGGVGGCAC